MHVLPPPPYGAGSLGVFLHAHRHDLCILSTGTVFLLFLVVFLGSPAGFLTPWPSFRVCVSVSVGRNLIVFKSGINPGQAAARLAQKLAPDTDIFHPSLGDSVERGGKPPRVLVIQVFIYSLDLKGGWY